MQSIGGVYIKQDSLYLYKFILIYLFGGYIVIQVFVFISLSMQGHTFLQIPNLGMVNTLLFMPMSTVMAMKNV